MDLISNEKTITANKIQSKRDKKHIKRNGKISSTYEIRRLIGYVLRVYSLLSMEESCAAFVKAYFCPELTPGNIPSLLIKLCVERTG